MVSRSLPTRLLPFIGPDAVGLREAPFTVVFLLVSALVVLEPGAQDPRWLLPSIAIVLAVQLVASLGRWRRWPRGWQYLLPLAQMAALVGLGRVSVADPDYSVVMLFFPVVSLALQPGFRGVTLGTVGTAVVTLAAAVTAPDQTDWGPLTWLPVLIITLCALAVGGEVFVVTERLRQRTAALVSLQREQDATLASLAASRDSLTDLAERLEDSRDLLGSVVDAATEVLVAATDLDGRIVIASPGVERVLGQRSRSLVGVAITDLVDQDELRREAAAQGLDASPPSLLRVLVGPAGTGAPQQREWTMCGADEQPVPVDLVVTRRRRLDDPDSEGYLLIGTDQSARHESERLQDEFVGLVSHELRTPLASIIGYVELLRADKGADDHAAAPENRRYLEVVERNAQRLLRLVNDLLLSVQVVAGTFSLLPEAGDAAEVVQESVLSLEPTAAAADVRLKLEAVRPLPLITDPERLGQVVENLLANAIKFAGRGGTVRVQVTPRTVAAGSTGVQLVVTDDGPGMTPQETARVTGRFFRTSSARRQRIRGIGLGLAIVDAIVRAHGGTLAIASEPGLGTSITVELPDLPESTPAPALPTSPGSSANRA